jgi:predicted metalloprotease with PDZ domain
MKYSGIILIILLRFNSVLGQDTIAYSVSFPNAVHHEAEISIELSNVNSTNIRAIMSKTSPGRYGVHDFGKNIYNIKVFKDDGSILPVRRIEPDVWEIGSSAGDVRIQYTLFANHADGTYSGIDADFANLNMPSSLMWVEKMEDRPVKIAFELPDTTQWKIATQLILIDSAKNSYFAPNLQYLMDSPCVLGNLRFKKIEFEDAGQPSISLAINTESADDELEMLKDYTKRVVLEQKAIFGEFPAFSEDRYTFLCSYGPGFYGDGMEHRNSTMISKPSPLTGNQNNFIGTISHEFFHAWNIERIRPESLEPFDFTTPNLSGELWFGEGFTSYYGDLTLCRAGIVTWDKYLSSLSSLINYCVNTPGWRYGSPVAMSEMATYADQSSFVDETNFSNVFLSYYNYGELIALALDLTLRAEFTNVSLDDLMRAMWTKYGVKETPYSNADIESTLAEVCGSKEFARSFFARHIYGNELPDFEEIFDKLGYKLIKKNPDRPSLGFVQLRFEGDTAVMLSNPLVGSGLYEAGVNRGDLILSIDDQPVTSYPELNFIVGTRKIGDELKVQYSHLGKLKTGTFKVKEENQVVLIPKEKFSIRLKEEEEELRNNWLKSRL